MYIPANRNGNQKKFAIITFAKQEEMEAAQSKPIKYNNYTVHWENYTGKKPAQRRGSINSVIGKYDIRSVQGSDQGLDIEAWLEDNEKRRLKTNDSEKKKERNKHESLSPTEDLLQKILERLERLEMQNKVQETGESGERPYRS